MRHTTALLAACLLLLFAWSSARAPVRLHAGDAATNAKQEPVVPAVLVHGFTHRVHHQLILPPTYSGQFLRRAKLLETPEGGNTPTNEDITTEEPAASGTDITIPGLPEATPGAYYSPSPVLTDTPGYGNNSSSPDPSLPGSAGGNSTQGFPGSYGNSTERHNTTKTPEQKRQQEKKNNEQQASRTTTAAAATAGTTMVATSTMSALAGAAAGNVAATAVGGAATTAVAGAATSAAATSAVAGAAGASAAVGASTGAGVAMGAGGVASGVAAGSSAGGTVAGTGAGVSAGLAGSGATTGATTSGGIAATGGGTTAFGTGGVTQMTSSSKLASALDINQYMSQGPLITMFGHLQMIPLLSDGLDAINVSSPERAQFVQFYRDVSGSLEWVVFRYRDECLQRAKFNGTEAQARCLWRAGKGQAMILGSAFLACMCAHAVVLLLFFATCCKRWQPPTLLAFPNLELLLMSIMVIPITQCACYLLSAGILGGLTKAYILAGFVLAFLGLYALCVLIIVARVVGRRDAWGLIYVLNPYARSFRSKNSGLEDPGCSVFAVVSGGCHVDLSQWHGSWNVDDILTRGPIRTRYNTAGGGFLGFVSRAISQTRAYGKWHKEQRSRGSFWDLNKSPHDPAADAQHRRDQQLADTSAKVVISNRYFTPDPALRVEMDDRLGAVYLDYKGETVLHASWHLVRLMYQVGIAALLASSRVSTANTNVLLWSGGIWQMMYAIMVLVIQPYCNRWFGLLEAVCQFLQTANVFILALMASTDAINVPKEIFLYISLSSVAVTMLGSWLRIVAMFWRIEGLYFVIKRPRVLQQLHSMTTAVAPCTAQHFKDMNEAADELEQMRVGKMAVDIETVGELTSPKGRVTSPKARKNRQSELYQGGDAYAAQPMGAIPEVQEFQYRSGHVELSGVQLQMQPPYHGAAYR